MRKLLDELKVFVSWTDWRVTLLDALSWLKAPVFYGVIFGLVAVDACLLGALTGDVLEANQRSAELHEVGGAVNGLLWTVMDAKAMFAIVGVALGVTLKAFIYGLPPHSWQREAH